MTTEATFAAALDADPTDWQTRLVFSDWLLDQGDMRWEGMRWLGVKRKWPERVGKSFDWNGPKTNIGGTDNTRLSYEAIRMISDNCRGCIRADGVIAYVSFATRTEAEDAFCRAYPALAAAHPAEFAVGVMV